MRYRGFIITACFDSGIERYNRETGKDELCKGYYCQVYAGNDDMYDEQIDDFCLAAGHEIEDLSDAALTKGIREYVDGMHHELEEGMNFNKKSRLANILGRAVCFLGEFQSGEELYDTLTDQIGLSGGGIREIGFKSLAPFFNRDYYAQTIAEHLIVRVRTKRIPATITFPSPRSMNASALRSPATRKCLKRSCPLWTPRSLLTWMPRKTLTLRSIWTTARMRRILKNR